MNWKPGDRAIVSLKDSGHYGRECTVLAVQVLGKCKGGDEFLGAEVDLVCSSPGRWQGNNCVFMYCNLTPIDDKYDGLEVTTWDECPWQPERILVSEEHT